MDGFLIPLIHHWGGGIRPARRRAEGLKGASISDFNGKDGAITWVEGQCSCLVCCCVYASPLNSVVSVSLEIFFFVTSRVTRTHVRTINYILHSHGALCFHFGTVVQRTHNAILECAFLSSMVFISNLLFQFTHFENVPWLMCGGAACSVYLYIKEWNIHIVRFLEQKLSRFSVNGTWD